MDEDADVLANVDDDEEEDILGHDDEDDREHGTNSKTSTPTIEKEI